MSTLIVDLPAALGLGQEPTTLTFVQISLRGVIVFMTTLAIIRCGDRRPIAEDRLRCGAGIHPRIDAGASGQRDCGVLSL